MIADLAQTQQTFEYIHSRLGDPILIDLFQETVSVSVPVMIIQLALFSFHRTPQHGDGLVREIFRNLFLRTPKGEGVDQLFEVFCFLLASEFVDVNSKLPVEIFTVPDQSGVEEIKLGEQIRSVVLNGRTTEDDPVNGTQFPYCFCNTRNGIFDSLAFVKDNVLPEKHRKLLEVIPNYPIRCKHQVILCKV